MDKKTFQQGDILEVDLVGTSGARDRFQCMVISPILFNDMGMVIVALVTREVQMQRHAGFAVNLEPYGFKGAVLTNNLRTLDVAGANAALLKERHPEATEMVVARVQAIFADQDSGVA
ncbi:mRNA-degrading endonuclease toxin of MazEF toxin-antitoxin module [Pseudomonas nitritireducens]|uniref:mRNA-degrading endonuclease toxin of MazEF toxin-antitoxin module n=1 Tax=Pseudomonas nitroreducens TaxID=46680 RepID=A0A7W7P5S8_PSENT|nr:type II toxin-antitoxin system PemK/MazF family toxin [Pseudomonas nitritireducens]MBB4867607.1 mRNA-degrading endonuclease toxin of MazEF toxin-antitoxin module [Pseudomonas nitritireducens]